MQEIRSPLSRCFRVLGRFQFSIILFLITALLSVNLSSVAKAGLRTRCSEAHPEFPGILSISTSKTVQDAMEQDWKAGLKDQLERGRWIQWNKQTGEFSVSAVKVGNANTGDKEVDIGIATPDSENLFTVGMYHTHPPNPKYPDIGPSQPDKTKANLLRIPSLVRDSDADTPDPNDYQTYLVGPGQACEPEDPKNDDRVVKLPKEIFKQPNQDSGNASSNGSNGNGTNNDNGANNSSGNSPASSDSAGPKGTGSSYGDPHIVTLDGFRYSFQTVGEFLLGQSTDGQFIVQTRQERVPKQDLSLNTAVATKIGRDRVGYYAQHQGKSDAAILRVNGEAITLKDETVKLPDGGLLQKQGTEYTIESSRGEQVIIRPIQVAGLQFMNVTVIVPSNYQDKMTGLLGDFDTNPNNDLKTRSGKLLPSKSSYSTVGRALSNFLPTPIPFDEIEKGFFDKLHRDFGDSWRIQQKDSLFDYETGQSTATFTDRSFPKRYHNLASLMPNQIRQAETVCRQAGVTTFMLEGCILDVGFTGEAGFAQTMVNALTRTVVDRAVDRALDEVRSRVKIPIRIPGLPF